MKRLFIFMLFPLLFFSFTVAAQQQPPNWQAVEKVFGRKGAVQEDVFKVTFPRSDLRVKVGEVSIEPGLALTSWIAFKQAGNHAIIMGDLALLEEEIAPVMKKFVKSGIKVTSLHHHIIGESPSVMYMHFSGEGNPVKLAKAMSSALEKTGTLLTSPELQESPATVPNWTKVESILGRTGKRERNLLKFSIPRAETITENGMDIPPSMGMATAINFQMVGEEAATTGDFVLLAYEVNSVVKALTEHGITVTAIHNHMLYESPRLFFLHFWGVGEPKKLAEGLKAALDQTNSLTVKKQ